MKEMMGKLFKEAGFDLSQEKLQKFQRYTDLIVEYNEKFNLTAITQLEDIISKHYIDSLMGKDFLDDAQMIVDIGSGAGFPSLPLKIACPEKKFILLDSLNKRIGFLNIVIEQIALKDIETQHIRIEDAARTIHRNNYDRVVARAVAPLNTLLEYSFPLLKKGGRLIAYKGDKAEEEIAQAKRALNLLHGEVVDIKEYTLANTYKRNIVIVEKKKETPEIYPRPQNKPKKLPL